MITALIPPVPDLGKYESTGTHLLLSHLLDHPRYREYYGERSRAGDYLILDNSAHEHGVGNSPEVLMRQARDVGASEVVVPDVLFDYRGTVESSKRCLAWLSGDGASAYEEAGSPRLMLVPQGQDKGEWVRCLNDLLSAWNRYEGAGSFDEPVIGVSKDYDDMVRGGIALLCEEHLEAIHLSCIAADVHCLGWPKDLWATAKVARACPWVRSTDSAKPFVYAKAGILLEPGGDVPEYPHRDPHYFDRALAQDSHVRALRNVEVFKAAASNTLIMREEAA